MSTPVKESVRHIGLEAALIGLPAADAAVSILPGETHPLHVTFAVILVASLIVRTRTPYCVFALTIPALVTDSGAIAALVGLFSVAERRPARYPLILCALTTFVCYTTPWEHSPSYWGLDTAWEVIYSLIFTIAPVLLGLLVRARRELSIKLEEIERARHTEQELLIEQALARERADLAREMHDVVSHQVSLIVVQAGALQVTARDDSVAQCAETIRALCVRTLDELRQMVGVLRAAGNSSAELPAHPGIDDLPSLVAASGVPTTVNTSESVAVGISTAAQRVIYRAVQEGLTNVAKHAPGASARLDLVLERGHVLLTLTNTKPTRLPDRLPSAQHGLLGLRERATLIGGSLTGGRLSDGGYRLLIALPAQAE